jgi:O-antigen/teichoic acid export membrane protein
VGLKRGTLLLSLGWASQLLFGYAINAWLAHVFGAAGLGLYGVAMSILLWIEIGVISGLPTAVQKFTASHPGEAGGILRSANRLQAVSVTVIFAIAFLAAPLSSRWLGDERLAGLLRIAIWDLWFYGFFFVFMSFQNGLKRFGNQAFLVAFYAAFRLAFNLIFVSLYHSITSALLANIAASACGLAAGLVMSKSHAASQTIARRLETDLIRFAWPVALYSLILHLLQNVDLWFVKSNCGPAESGYYYAAGILAKIPYYLFFALSAVLLPVISEAIAKKEMETARRSIREAMRFLWMAALPLALLAHRFGRDALELLFPKDFGQAAGILAVLIWGMTLLAVYFLFTTILSADNRPRLALWITLATVVFDVLFNIIWVPRYGAMGAAAATTASILIGSVVGGVRVRKRFGSILSGRAFGRILIASAAVYGLSFLVSVHGWMVLPVAALLGIIYLVILFVLRELRREDLAWIGGAKA